MLLRDVLFAVLPVCMLSPADDECEQIAMHPLIMSLVVGMCVCAGVVHHIQL